MKLSSDMQKVLDNNNNPVTETVKLRLHEGDTAAPAVFNLFTPAVYTENGNITVTAEKDDIIISGDIITDGGKIDLIAQSDVTMTEGAGSTDAARNWFTVSAAGGKVTATATTGSIDFSKTRGIRTKHVSSSLDDYYDIDMTAGHNIYVIAVDACGHMHERYNDDSDIDLNDENKYKAKLNATVGANGKVYVLTIHANLDTTTGEGSIVYIPLVQNTAITETNTGAGVTWHIGELISNNSGVVIDLKAENIIIDKLEVAGDNKLELTGVVHIDVKEASVSYGSTLILDPVTSNTDQESRVYIKKLTSADGAGTSKIYLGTDENGTARTDVVFISDSDIKDADLVVNAKKEISVENTSIEGCTVKLGSADTKDIAIHKLSLTQCTTAITGE
ncbi:MAG: hypothetical protein HUJ76_13000, partial [Parasporobacterium sp.]|nr:hypothetical protein [Parasporobacterium sp.]